MVTFSNLHDQLLVNIPVLLHLNDQKDLTLYSIDTVPMPFDTETLDGKNNEYTFINNSYPYMAINQQNYIPLDEQQLRLCNKMGANIIVKIHMYYDIDLNTHVNRRYITGLTPRQL